MKALKWILIIVAVLGVVSYFGFDYMKTQTKKHSPEDTVSYTSGNFTASVEYCRPYKKGREIFGGLVPLNKVWRTGANEATKFTINKVIDFGGVKVQPGTYTLWTIPQETQWTVILSSKIYDWGVGFDSEAAREPEYDVAIINVAVQEIPEEVEQFTIEFIYNVNMVMSWDKTRVTVPIQFSGI